MTDTVKTIIHDTLPAGWVNSVEFAFIIQFPAGHFFLAEIVKMNSSHVNYQLCFLPYVLSPPGSLLWKINFGLFQSFLHSRCEINGDHRSVLRQTLEK